MSNMILSMAGRILQFIVMFATVKAMSTILTPEQFGNVSIITAVVAFYSMFFINPIGTYLNRHINSWTEKGELRSVFRYYAKYLTCIAIIAIITSFFYFNFQGNNDGRSLHYSALVAFCLLIITINQTLIPSLNLLGFVKEFTILTVGSVTLSLLFAIVFVEYLGGNAATWMLGISLGQLIVSLVACKVYIRHSKLNFDKSNKLKIIPKEILKFSVPVALSAGLYWINFQGYRLVAVHFVGLQQFGIFAAGYGLAVQMMAAAELVLNTWFQPDFYKSCESTNLKIRRTAWVVYARKMITPVVLTLSFGYFLAPIFIRYILGPMFQNTVDIYRFGLLVEAIRIFIGVSTLYFHQQKQTYFLLLPSAIGALISVLLILSLVSAKGVVYILPSVGAGAFVNLSILMLIIFFRQIKKPIKTIKSLDTASLLDGGRTE